MTLLKKIWTGENEDDEVTTAYQYVIDLCERVEDTCNLAKEELAKSRQGINSTIIGERVTGSSVLR